MIIVINLHNFAVSEEIIKKAVIETLKKHNYNKDLDVEVAVVDGKEMEELNKLYYKDEVYEHPVFTFPENQNKDDFKLPPDTNKSLGQIVLNYDFAQSDEKVYDLISHSTLHLLGIHH